MRKGHINMGNNANKIQSLDMVRVGDKIVNEQGVTFVVKENRIKVIIVLREDSDTTTYAFSIDDILKDPMYLVTPIEQTINSLLVKVEKDISVIQQGLQHYIRELRVDNLSEAEKNQLINYMEDFISGVVGNYANSG